MTKLNHSLALFCVFSLATLFPLDAAVDQVPEKIFVNGTEGTDTTGQQQRPYKSLSAALARLPDPLKRSVTIEWVAGNETSTGAQDMSADCLVLMRRMPPGVRVSILGRPNPAGELPQMGWEGGAAMVDAREGDWWLENVRIGTGTTRQRRGVLVSGPAMVTLKNVTFRTRSLSDAAIYAHRGGLIELRGRIAANEHLHERSERESFGGIIAVDHGIVRFAEREQASLELGNGSLSASFYGVIRLGCASARITSWGEQSNCLAINNGGRIDLHNTTTRLSARLKQNTPIGLEHDGHVLAEGARIIVEGTNNQVIVLQKASTLTCNDVEIRGAFSKTIEAMSGSMFTGRFKSDVTGIHATTGATVNIEAVEGKLIGPVTAERGGLVSLPDGKVFSSFGR